MANKPIMPGWINDPSQKKYIAPYTRTSSVLDDSEKPLSDILAEIDRKFGNVATDWASISGKPETFPPTAHTHDDRYIPYGAASTAGQFDKTATTPTDVANRLNYNGILYGSRVMGSWYNDYAEIRESDREYEAGTIVISNNGVMKESDRRLSPLGRVVSDTYGMCIGHNDKFKCAIPVAVSGRALVQTDFNVEEQHLGMAVCTGVNGKASLMTNEELEKYPWAVLGFIESIPNEETWGNENIQVNNRVWIEVK